MTSRPALLRSRSTREALAVAALLFASSALLGSPAHGQQPADSQRDPIAIVNVTVITLTEDDAAAPPIVVPQATVLVVGDEIRAVGSADEVLVPPPARRIDGTGQFLIPGLTEMHGHVPVPDDPTPGLFSVDATLALFLANGVTSVRSMLGDDSHFALREELESGARLGPALELGSPALFGTPELNVERAVELIQGYAERGYDFVKFHENLPSEVYEISALTCRELDLPFAGHVTDFVSLTTVFGAGQSTIDHMDNFLLETSAEPGEVPQPNSAPHMMLPAVRFERLPELAAATREAGIAVVPTLLLFETFANTRTGADLAEQRPEVAYAPRELRDYWSRSADNRIDYYLGDDLGQRWIDARRAVFQALIEADVTILCGTDSPQEYNVPGFSMAREMTAMVDAGLTPHAVLRSATRSTADFRGRAASEGRVAPGYRADLVLLAANPLEDIAHVGRVEGVLIGGRYLDRAALDALLESALPEPPSAPGEPPGSGADLTGGQNRNAGD